VPLSWNEIKHRAIAFSKEWKDETREEAEAKSFWDAFFHVFGQQCRHVASYEEPVKKLSGDWGFIDLFRPKTLLAEHKSAGKDLGKAHAQGMEYIRGLVDGGRGKEVPESGDEGFPHPYAPTHSGISPSPQSSPAGRGGHARRVPVKKYGA